MKRYTVCLALIFACVSLPASLETPRTAFAQDSWSDSGVFVNEGISLTWERINSSEADSRCILSVDISDDGKNFIRFAFEGKETFVRCFFTEKKAVFSHRKETPEINLRERVFFERERSSEDAEDDAEAYPLRTVKISVPDDGNAVSLEALCDAMKFDFGEFAAYAKIPGEFLRMFEKYSVLYSADDAEYAGFFMPKPRELAIAVGSRKSAKEITIYFSPHGRKEFFLWRIALVDGMPVAAEYSSRENLFWVDEDGDGFSEFCLKEEQGNWLWFECLKEIVFRNERAD